MIFFIVFFAFAIVATVGRSKLKTELGTSEKCLEFLEEESLAVSDAEEYWCSGNEYSCPCYI